MRGSRGAGRRADMAKGWLGLAWLFDSISGVHVHEAGDEVTAGL